VARSKRMQIADAVALVEDGARLGLGGVLLRRKPMAFLAALADAGRRDLRLFCFLASMDVELLVARGAVAETHTGYVGFEQLGFAPAYDAAVAAGRVQANEYSELLFVAGLRAAGSGVPFLPIRGAIGSDIVPELGLREIVCPYTGETLLAAPAIRPEIAVIHAEAADASGNVRAPSTHDFLYDADAALARAADRVIVTVERVVETAAIRGRDALLFSFEVDAIIEAPGGAWPTAVPGLYGSDVAAVRRYLTDAAADSDSAARTLMEGRP
jgi:glutaconate CoA-transferase, subunit A